MKQIKFYSKQLLQFGISTILFITLLSILQYFIHLSNKTSHILTLAFILLLSFILGAFAGKNASSKGYVEGLKLSGLMIIILLLCNVIFFQSNFTLPRILYYFLILTSTIIGAMIGINKKKK